MAEQEAKLKIIKAVSDNWAEGYEHVREYEEVFEDDYRFLFKFEHYDDKNANERDRRRLKPKTRQLASKHRHKTAVIVKQLRHLSARAVDDSSPDDQMATEHARWFMEYELNDRKKRWKFHLYDAVSLCIGAGAGALALDVRYDLGPYPEVRPRLLDPRCLKWTPGWNEPTDDTCPWVIEECWMRPEDVEAMGEFGWKDTRDVAGSAPAPDGSARPTPFRPIQATDAPQPGNVMRDMVRVLKCWYRFDRTAYKRAKKNAEGGKLPDIILDPEDRYMACPSCGYEDRTQPGQHLEETGGVCMACYQQGIESLMKRVDAEEQTETVLAYPSGHRLVICAPDQGRLFYDGGWPYLLNGKPPRNVPYAFFKCYRQPLEPWGSCDTDWDWSLVVIANACSRRGYEFVSRSGGIIITSGDGLWDATGKKPYEFTDRPLSIAKWRGMGAPGVEFFQPHGMLNELMPYMQGVNSELRTDAGIADLQVTAENTKDIPASTLAQLERSGEIPQDDLAERIADELSGFVSVWYDIKRAVMTEQQLVGLRAYDGRDIFMRLRGEQMANADVILELLPSWNQYDMERTQKLDYILGKPPETWPLYMKVAGIPMSYIRDLTMMAQQIQMQNPAAFQAQATPPAPNAGPVPTPAPVAA